MIHDVNYSLANGNADALNYADELALKRLQPFSSDAIIMRAGLMFRKLFRIYVNKPTDVQEGVTMREFLLSSPYYKSFGISQKDFIV